MPSKSKSQQRFFGMVDAYKKGEMKNASSKIKKAANGMSMSDVKDFAETKHKGLPEKVEEQTIIRLTEGDLHRIVKRTINELTGGDGGSWANHSGPQVYNHIRDQVGRTVMSMMQECQKYINNNDESALSQLYWLCSSFTDEYDKAFKDGNEIYGGMKLRQ